jgi:hypothetical protein
MKTHSACSTIGVLLLSLLTANVAGVQLAPLCVEDSPERRSEVGCSIIDNKPLPDGLKEPLFWHIDALDSPERARAALPLPRAPKLSMQVMSAALTPGMYSLLHHHEFLVVDDLTAVRRIVV